jgi:hypothetical protein
MPGAPKARDVGGKVRKEKVCGNADAEQFSDADSYVTITGEIPVDLERKKDGPHQYLHTAVLIGVCENRINKDSYAVSYSDLFEQAIGYLLDCPYWIHGTSPGHAVSDFAQEVTSPFDWAGHKLREIGQKECITPETSLDLGFAPIKIDRVGHCLKGIEGNPNRQDKVPTFGVWRQFPPKSRAERPHVLINEPAVLEKGKDPQIAAHTECHQPFVLVFRPFQKTQPTGVIEHG